MLDDMAHVDAVVVVHVREGAGLLGQEAGVFGGWGVGGGHFGRWGGLVGFGRMWWLAGFVVVVGVSERGRGRERFVLDISFILRVLRSVGVVREFVRGGRRERIGRSAAAEVGIGFQCQALFPGVFLNRG